jgi:hypothetical protein
LETNPIDQIKTKQNITKEPLTLLVQKESEAKNLKQITAKKLDEDTVTKSNTSSSSSGATSALDNLLFQTAPGMTPNQRRNLRKSLVDEVFEELVQRHHDRVLQQLRLDVEDFIAPNSSDDLEESTTDKSTFNNNSKTSFRSSSTSSPMTRLKKCESMDFKDVASVSSASSSSFNTKNKSEKDRSKKNSNSSSTKKIKSPDAREGFKLSFLSSAKKYGEAINRKYFARPSRNKDSLTQNDDLIVGNKSSVKMREKASGKTKNRPLSAFLLPSSISKSSNIVSEDPNINYESDKEYQFRNTMKNVSMTDNVLAKPASFDKRKELSRSKSTGVTLTRRNSDFDFVDSDEEVPSRRLQRSKIIASFLEQLNDSNAVDDDFEDNDENVIVESMNNNTSTSLNNNSLKYEQS